MIAFKEQLNHLLKESNKMKIKWEFMGNNGSRFPGEYDGEVKDGRPHGLGRWKRYGKNWVIEAEWKDGLPDGKAIMNYLDGDR